MNMLRHIALLLLTACCARPAQGQTTWHVDDECTPPGTGTQLDPFCTIQQGIDAAVDGVAHVPIKNDTDRRLVLFKNFDEVLCLRPRPKVIAIDVPIGLLDQQNAVHVNVTAKLEAF